MSGLPTLSKFIEISQRRFPNNGYVEEPHWDSLYVRYTKRYIKGKWYNPVLDLANIQVEEGMQGKGVFTELVARLRNEHPGLHLYVENTTERFGGRLLKLGFFRINELERSYLLEARLCLACRKRYVAGEWKTCCGDGDCIGTLSNRGLAFQEM